MRFRSSAAEGWVSLAQYVARMKDGQEAIYILIGDDAAALASSAQLEGFRARGLEVLLLSDAVDAFWPERMSEFDGKPIRSVTQGAADLSKFAAEAGGEAADTAKRRTGRAGFCGAPVVEINPGHALVAALAKRAEAGEDLGEVAEILLDVARVQDGEAPADPAAFARRVVAAMVG